LPYPLVKKADAGASSQLGENSFLTNSAYISKRRAHAKQPGKSAGPF